MEIEIVYLVLNEERRREKQIAGDVERKDQ